MYWPCAPLEQRLTMRLRVYAAIHGGPISEISIPCGAGNQSIKWLALAAVNRMSASNSPRQLPGGLFSLAPTDVTKGAPFEDVDAEAATLFIHPMDSISKHFRDEDFVTVWMTTAVLISRAGRPLASRWSIIAFDISEGQRQRRNEAIEEVERLAAERENAITFAREAERNFTIASKAKQMRSVLRSKELNDETFEKSLKKDWLAILQLRNFVMLCKGPEALYDVQQQIKLNYAVASELYKSCSSSTSGLTRDGLDNSAQSSIEQTEFTSFLFDSRIFDVRCSMEVSSQLFKTCLSPQERVPSLQMPGFLFSLVLIAWLKYIDGGNREGPISRRVPQEYANKSAQASLSLAKAVSMLFDEHLNSRVESGGVGFHAARALDNDEVLACLQDHEENLRSKFNAYASSKSESGTIVMKLEDFGVLIEHSGLVGKTEGGDLNVREVRQAFAGAQGDQIDELDSSHMLEMDYREFIEALVRVALIKYKSGSSASVKEIESIASIVCNVPAEMQKQRHRRCATNRASNVFTQHPK